MADSKNALYDASGQEIKKSSIPTVMWKDHVLPLRLLTQEECVPEKQSISPGHIIRELRAQYVEMNDRFTLLASGLAVLAKTNPELKEFLDSVGIEIKDLKGNHIYKPEAQPGS